MNFLDIHPCTFSDADSLLHTLSLEWTLLSHLPHHLPPQCQKLEEMLRVKLIKIAHFDQCVLIEIAATLALNQFQQRYTQEMITIDPLLRIKRTRLTEAKTKAWNDRFAAESAAYPPTLESILWIVAKSGYTKEVARFMNLSKATRECKNLQRYMREVMNRSDESQLHYYCMKGLTSSVKRMLEMKSIDVEARQGSREDGWTCLMIATRNGYLDICGLLIDKGAQIEAKESDGWTPIEAKESDGWTPIEAKESDGWTPLHFAAFHGRIEAVRLLGDRGADVESCDYIGWRPLHKAASNGHISIIKELIEVRNAEINARDDRGRTALRYARNRNKADIVAYLV